ncbi:hypothetical protein V474_05250 [Novosphingobium barchaimii LL02]|uniref:DUF3617 family protein n=1 Tax=Novosphingobium barchaimii LL02 TaxID=1114963 RepID=A0A0J7XJ73_9SPHN|nr:hypothetical protein [Novosphingobium barchaimii]KMS51183.1 hypothetical protein V474_05250 [Novosphingobium barchaimii LL02]
MRFARTAMMLATLIVLAAAAAGPVNIAQLNVMRDVRAGMWQHTFTTIPKNPGVPNQSEKACVSQADLGVMLEQSLKSSLEEQHCPITVESDAMTMARFTMHCPAINIPELGVSAPGADMPATIQKTGGEEHWTVSVKTPPVPGVAPAAVWRHEYRRLGACPG